MNGEADIERLLKQVTEIRLRHEEEARRTGENWNVFYAIGKRLYKRELLHSHFISVLLEPKNPAGKGNVFLKLFLETLAEECEGRLDISAFCTRNVKIITEKDIGPITKDYESGGRIDIFIEKDGKQIVIENKIDAGEQQNQLYRYHKEYPDAALFYLTLDGKEATEKSLKDLRQDQYIRLSYRHHILKWLEKCRQITAGRPEFQLLNAAIRQYIGLNSDLTGQGRIPKMTKEIADVLSQNKESIESAYNICSSYIQAQNKIVTDRFLRPIETFVKDTYGQGIELKTRINDGRFIIEFYLYVPEWKHLRIRFDNEKVIEGCFGIYGFGFPLDETIDTNPENKKISVFAADRLAPEAQTDWWPFINGIDDYPFWERDTIISLFDNAGEVIQYYKEKIIKLFELAEQMKANGIEL